MRLTMSERRESSNSTLFELLTSPLRAFAKAETFGGIFHIACTMAALVWANLSWSAACFDLWHANLTSSVTGFANTIQILTCIALVGLLGTEILRSPCSWPSKAFTEPRSLPPPRVSAAPFNW